MSSNLIHALSGFVSLAAFVTGMIFMARAKSTRWFFFGVGLVCIGVAAAWLAFVTMLAITVTLVMLFLGYRQLVWYRGGRREAYGLRHLALSARRKDEK